MPVESGQPLPPEEAEYLRNWRPPDGYDVREADRRMSEIEASFGARVVWQGRPDV